jgi:hypothetical protein
MGKSRNYDKEFNKVQKLAHENKQLKKEVSRLRKEMDKLEHRYENLDDLVQHQYNEDYPDRKLENPLIKPAKKWNCHKCAEGMLKLVIINRPDGAHYLRKCSHCPNKTRLKKYTDGVDGG